MTQFQRKCSALALFTLAAFCFLSETSAIFDNGFGEKYQWVSSLEDALETAKNYDKPIMMIVHKSWCGACKSLKPKFADSEGILALSKQFVMLNLMDNDEPNGNEFKPDGGYIPRILFMSSSGQVLPEFYNEFGSENHKYFYSSPDPIIASMKKVLSNFKNKPSTTNNEDHNEL